LSNKFLKTPIIFPEQIKFIPKPLYPFIILTSYIFLFKSLPQKPNPYSKIPNYILYSPLIINTIILISIATQTHY
ncbi:O-antigen ligase family protein, partial [Bacillus pseudomycoides]|uniref:O-antigen ligase family protein n=1 Tax=Bacillus pseudomycoides TaxID=64104 RepID=UPI003703CBC7